MNQTRHLAATLTDQNSMTDGVMSARGTNRTDLSKLEKGASYPGLEIIAHLAIVCRRVESHRAPIGVAIRGNLRRPIKC
jgi:hypothetical protein